MLPGSCALACFALITTGCVQKEFQDVKAQNIMSSNPIHLDAEEVSLNQSQIECGVQADLWEPPVQSSQDHSTARLSQAGRDLHFGDDVIVAEPGFHQPHVQVRGDFMMQLADGPSIREDGPDGRYAEGKLYVLIPHNCFQDPLPLLGVRKGNFSQDANPIVHFKLLDDGWHFDRIVH